MKCFEQKQVDMFREIIVVYFEIHKQQINCQGNI